MTSSRVLVSKPALGKVAAKSTAKPKPALQYFSTEETAISDSSVPTYSLTGISILAASGGGESQPPRQTVAGRLRWPMQAKLQVGAVDDPLEHEADRAAERVMRMPDPGVAPSLSRAGGLLQRKCSCGGSGEEECEACKEKHEKDHIRRKADGNAGADQAPPLVHEVLRSPGEPLDKATRRYFEPRFAYDFSRVRIHTDTRAAESAHSVHALAYTVGDRVVFGSGQYAPRTDSGRRLIAHELAHTIQQRSGVKPRVQRAVRYWDDLKRYLTYSWKDWAITDADAHNALMMLKALNPNDLKDTVAAMEKEGWVKRLFSNVSDEDQKKETDLLERINDLRVHKGKKGQPDIVGPCDQKQRKAIDDRVGSTKDWAREAKKRANDFAADPAKHADTGKLLDTHFFHQKNNGQMAEAAQISNAGTIAANFETAELQHHPIPNLCASPFDPLCASLALAYVRSDRTRAVFCDKYFKDTPERQVYHLLHEFMHEFANVRDRGYGNERVYAYLSPADAMNNADSYALFALDVNATKEKSGDVRPVPKDSVSDCGDKEPEVRRSFAFGARMITNALNVIGDPHIGAVEAQTHFKTSDRKKLQRVIDRFKKIKKEKFNDNLNFECENKCGDEVGYRRTWGWTIHLCPAWFKLDADTRADYILLIAIAEEMGMDYGPTVGSPEYVKLSEKKAYDSATAYVGYAREVTKNYFA